MTTVECPKFPKCAGCGLEIKSFEQWFTEDCPDLIQLRPEERIHQLNKQEWMSLPFEARKVV